MTRDFPDELLSAFLDNELSPAERATVEQHLADNANDRQLLTELKSLRCDLAALPQVAVKADFADRVVRAAVTAAQQRQPGDGDAVLPSVSSRRPLPWMVGAALTAAA